MDDLVRLVEGGPEKGVTPDGFESLVQFLTDLCHVQAARAAGEVSRICSELIHGYQRHPAWDAEACAGCYEAEDLEGLEGVMPGILSTAESYGDVIQKDAHHPDKAGPCVRPKGLEDFNRLRLKLDGCMTGCRLAKDRAADSLSRVMIPEALGYPL
jgi:hypothetical protein